MVIFISAIGLFSSCNNTNDDSNPCVCFRNDSSTAISGIKYRLSGTVSWTYSYFEETQYGGDGFDCSEGEMDTQLDDGTYDFQLIKSGGSDYWIWYSVNYTGGNLGFLVSNTAGASLCAAVDDNCDQKGSVYYGN